MPVRLIDSCVAIEIIRHHPYYVEKFLELPPDTCAISMLTYVELTGGLVHNPSRERSRRVHEFLNLVSVLAFDRTAGDCAAMVRGTMAKHGRTAGDFDEAIAGHALSHKLIMVSKDGDFIDAIATLIPGMQVEPWLSPDDDAKRKRKPR